MPIQGAKIYRVFIASPRDVTEERNIIKEQINSWNTIHAENQQMMLMPIGWETEATPSLEARGQEVINRQLVDNCDLLIGVFWNRLGTQTPEAESGTVEEIERARSQGKRCIIYFSYREISLEKADLVQYERLQEYKRKLQAEGLTDSYKTHDEFNEKVFRHITSAVLDIAREEKERKAAENEAKLTEQAIEIKNQYSSNDSSINLRDSSVIFNTLTNERYLIKPSFNTLSEAQISVKQLLESPFGIQDMEDAKEEEIAKIQTVLSSPELAELLSRQATVETISAIAQVLEVATTPSLYALASIGRYANETSLEWLDIVGDWVERLSSQKLESGYVWISHIKTYPGLLSLYALGISALRAGKLKFLQEIVSLSVYDQQYNISHPLLQVIHPSYVFNDEISQMIEPGYERRSTPVNDHLTTFFRKTLYPNEEENRYLNWFDFFEFLLSLKSVQQLPSYPYPYSGSFIWRKNSQRLMLKMLQDTALGAGKYGESLLEFFNGINNLETTAQQYDALAKKQGTQQFGRVYLPSYISNLIQLAKQGRRVANLQELNQIYNSNK
jgi:hypothetical protein